MFQVDDLLVKYEQKEVIQDFSFSIEKGEMVSIIGPNGSGKSTLLKAISGFIPHQGGNIALQSKNIKSMKKKRIAQQVCMLSQKNESPNDMTVRELIAYGRVPHKRWFQNYDEKDQKIIDWALEKTHLTEYAHRLMSSLSGGESQRAWIGMALAQQPDILLLDEPTTYLDIAHQHEILELMQTLNQEMNMTIVMVLHDLNQASFYSDRVLVMQSGMLEAFGAPQEVMTQQMVQDVYCMNCEIQCSSLNEAPRVHLLSTSKS